MARSWTSAEAFNDGRPTMDVLDTGGPEAIFTGLLDAEGNKLYRRPERVVMGFQGRPRPGSNRRPVA